jgi:hypothetical protein
LFFTTQWYQQEITVNNMKYMRIIYGLFHGTAGTAQSEYYVQDSATDQLVSVS